MNLFRLLKANEIEARIQSIYPAKKGCVVLLYKDARCDMNILDETVGPENWQRSHEVIDGNLYCNVGINFKTQDGYDRWVWKQDVGVESNTEKEKGQASDSFKRACFNWGLGRELYTAPFIWIALGDNELVIDKSGNAKCYTKFYVQEIEYNENNEISSVVIVDGNGVVRFSNKKEVKPKEPKPKTPSQKKTTPKEPEVNPNKEDLPFPNCTKEQLEILNRQAPQVIAFALKKFNVAALSELTIEQAQFIIDSMKAKGTLR